jgi:hypothetical protein
MAQSAAPVLTEVTTLAGTLHANPLYPTGAPLIRAHGRGQPDPVTAAIARPITESGSVSFELPDGRPVVVPHLDGKTWIAQRCDEITRGQRQPGRPHGEGRARRHDRGEPAMIAAFRVVTTRITQLYWRPGRLAEDNGRMIIESRGLQR